MKLRLFTIFGLLVLGACQTIPYPERVAAYEANMRTQFIGKNFDVLVLALGPPNSDYILSDGRKLVQFSDERTTTSGGETYTTFETFTRNRTIRDKDGQTHVITETEQVPVLRQEPVYTRHLNCTKRFVISKENIVEDFKWEGNSCF